MNHASGNSFGTVDTYGPKFYLKWDSLYLLAKQWLTMWLPGHRYQRHHHYYQYHQQHQQPGPSQPAVTLRWCGSHATCSSWNAASGPPAHTIYIFALIYLFTYYLLSQWSSSAAASVAWSVAACSDATYSPWVLQQFHLQTARSVNDHSATDSTWRNAANNFGNHYRTATFSVCQLPLVFNCWHG